ncbi:MAG: hypothetical protein DMF53_26295 [Acidobacteria bacterium]|nr:MAG: hypothetical protein DMF53_26295 [Acidobacteriota bacterium]
MTALPAIFRSLPPGLSVSELRDWIYRHGFARPAGSPALVRPAAEDLVHKLSAANQGHDAWIPGWRVEEAGPDGGAVLSRGGLRQRARAGDYVLTFSEDLPPRAGCAATLRHRRESLTLQAGVYYAFGDAFPEPGVQGSTLRLYFHAAQESAVPVFAILTAELNAAGVPFTLKTMLRPDEGDRADATLLYLPPRRFPAFAAVLRQSSEPLGACLAPEVPLFTRPLAPGIGLAESPTTGESFGMHRCRLMAEGIVEAWSAGGRDEAALQESVRRRFAAEGLSLDHPHLNPGGVDVYILESS